MDPKDLEGLCAPSGRLITMDDLRAELNPLDPRDVASLSREELEAVVMDACQRAYERSEESPVASAVMADARSYPFLPPTLCDCFDQIEYCTDAQLKGYALAGEES